MKDYQRYMNRQKLSETGMARLLKLETEKPEKRRKPAPQWVKYAGMAASLFLVVGLFAWPMLRNARQAEQPNVTDEPDQELLFNVVEEVPFTTMALAGNTGMNLMEEADAAALFGCAPDDFAGLLEQVGLGEFNLEYYNVDMTASQVDHIGDRFMIWGSNFPPVEEEPVSLGDLPVSRTVWLEIYEGYSYQDEAAWAALEPCAFQDHSVTAACLENNSRAAAVFNVESGGKTYGVLYAVTADGERNAKELVTKMVRYLTANGLSISSNELIFNQVEGVPQNGNAPEGLHDTTMDVNDMGMILHSSGEWWDDICSEFGWTGYDVSGTSTPAGRDPETNYALTYFRINGQHRIGELQWDGSSFELALMPNMTDFAAYTAQDIDNWAGLEVSTVNGHPVTAAIYYHPSRQMYYAAATFVVEDVICDYGVFYQVCVKTEAEAKDLVTRAVNYLTSGGVFTEMYGEYGFGVMDYDELTQVSTQRPGMTVGESRPLSWEEMVWVCPPLAEELAQDWSGRVYFYPDGTLGSITLSGYVKSGPYVEPDHATALRHVTIVMGKEEETFRRNYVDGGYLGAETEGYRGIRLRGYWWHDPEDIWGNDEFDQGSDRFVCQLDPNLGWVAEIITSQKDGTFDENRWLNTDWVIKAMGNLWWKDDLTMETDGIFVREYDTLSELRGAVDEKFLPYLPKTLMDHDEFHGTWRRNSGEYESVDVRWDKPWVIQGSYARFSYSGDVDVMWPIGAMGLPQVTDINDRESYDFREHPGLVMPELTRDYTGGELYEKLYCPTFRAKDASLDLIESRIYKSDEYNSECRFQLLHDNNVLVNYRFANMTAEEIWTVVQETIPSGSGDTAVQLGGRYYMEAADGSALADSYLEIERKKPYRDIINKRMTVHFASRDCVCSATDYNATRGRVTYVCSDCKSAYTFDIVDADGEILRYVASGNKDCADDGTVFRHLKDGERAVAAASKPQVEPSGVFYLESAKGETLVYPYLNLNQSGNTFTWQRGEESSRSGSYAVVNGKVQCHQGGKTYVFETVDENTLRFVGAESDALDYLDTNRVTRTLSDGAALRRNDAQLGALDGEEFYHRPFEELSKELRDSLTWDGKVETAEGYSFRLRHYTGPGIALTTTEAPKETLEAYQEAVLAQPQEEREGQLSDREVKAEIQQEMGREWLYAVTITGGQYALEDGLKVGMTAEEAAKLGYQGELTSEGELYVYRQDLSSVTLTVKSGKITRIQLGWGLGRYVGKYWDI